MTIPQIVLDLDNTMLHCGWDREGCDIEPVEETQSILEMWRAAKDQSGILIDRIYSRMYSFRFKEGRKDILVYMKVRHGLFEFLTEIREFCDIHLYSKGAYGYVTAALNLLIGENIGTSNSLINGSLVTKDEDPATHKDIRHILPQDLISRAVIVDDQPAVWVQVLQVLPSPPFHVFSTNGTVTSDDKLMERKGNFLQQTSEHIKLISSCMSSRCCDAIQAIRWLRSTAFYRITSMDGRRLKLLVVAVKHSTESENAAHRHKLRDLCSMVLHYGGEVVSKPHPEVTHVVTDSSDNKWAERCGGDLIHTVQVQWLVDTILYLQRMEESHYSSVQVRRGDLRSALTVRSCDFLATFFKHCLPSIVEETKIRKGNISLSAVATSIAVLAVSYMHVIEQKWIKVQTLFNINYEDVNWTVESVPISSALSLTVLKGDKIMYVLVFFFFVIGKKSQHQHKHQQ